MYHNQSSICAKCPYTVAQGELVECFLAFKDPFPTQARLNSIMMLSKDWQHKDIF